MHSFKACWDCSAVLANKELREALAELTRTDLRQGLLPGGVSSSRLDALILFWWSFASSSLTAH